MVPNLRGFKSVLRCAIYFSLAFKCPLDGLPLGFWLRFSDGSDSKGGDKLCRYRLIYELWGSRAPSSSRNILTTHISLRFVVTVFQLGPYCAPKFMVCTDPRTVFQCKLFRTPEGAESGLKEARPTADELSSLLSAGDIMQLLFYFLKDKHGSLVLLNET